MPINKICFLLNAPLTKRIYQNYGFENLMARGFNVCYLDVTDFFNPGYRLGVQKDDISNKIEILRIDKKKKLINYMRNNHENSFFVVNLPFYYNKCLFVFKMMKKFKVKYAIYSMSPSPVNPYYFNYDSYKKNVPFFNRIFRKIYGTAISFFYSLPFWFNGIKAPTFILAAGRKINIKLPRTDKQTKIIYGHMPNYDNYLNKRKSIAPSERNYFVFLDQNLCFNPDLLLPGNKHLQINEEKYFIELNRLFDYLEGTFNTKVIIACHPTSQYHLKPGLFRGRIVEKGNTLELIASSRCVLTHYCTSIDYAFLYKKPILVFTSEELDLKYGGYLHGLADLLGIKPINMDNEKYSVCDLPKVEIEAYNTYITDYLKYPGTPDKPYWDIVADNIEELN